MSDSEDDYDPPVSSEYCDLTWIGLPRHGAADFVKEDDLSCGEGEAKEENGSDLDELWANLPPMLLEEIFLYLTIRQRYYCSMVCRAWYGVFHCPRVWRLLTVAERTFTYRRFNLFKGYQHEISHYRVQMCLARIARHVRTLVLEPLTNFFNLYEFIKVLATFLQFFDTYPMPQLKTFVFTFACESWGLGGTLIYGTGGQLLEELKVLLRNFRGLESLTLNQLLLELKEAPRLLDYFVEHCSMSLRYLEVLNLTKERYSFYYASMFPNLRTLVITPLQLTDDVLLLIGQNTKLADLVIVQDKYSAVAESISCRTWTTVRKDLPGVRVRLEVRGLTDADVLMQEGAPVHTIMYNSPYSRVLPDTTSQIGDFYRTSLRVYGHLQLPRRHGSRSFHDRADAHIILLIRECRFLETLIIRERVSTTTLLIIASEAKNLKALHVRRNAVLKRFDWPWASHWTNEFYSWLKATAKSETLVEQEISRLLDFKWCLLPDKVFMKLNM